MNLSDGSEDYFDKFSEDPVVLHQFLPESRRFADQYLQKLRLKLKDTPAEVCLRGSTAFGILGKGDIEFGVYAAENDWVKILALLRNCFGEAGNIEKDYARFNDLVEGYEIEIIVMRGRQVEIDRKLTEYMLNHELVLKEYEQLKCKYSFSKRQYQRQKDLFFKQIIKKLSEAEGE